VNNAAVIHVSVEASVYALVGNCAPYGKTP